MDGPACPPPPSGLFAGAMPIRDFTSTRLFLRAPLAAGARVDLDPRQTNYLVNVLRLGAGDELLVFNGRDGEWRAALVSIGRRHWQVEVTAQTRTQPPQPDLQLLFAPLKQARHDYMIEKAVEMGVGRLTPVITRHGQVARLNHDRAEANAIEAAEQGGILTIPVIDEPVDLLTLLDRWPAKSGDRHIVYCDEGDDGRDPVALLSALRGVAVAVLIGPEGGFAADEQSRLRSLPFVTAIPLGPRILRADTAAVAALALVQAVLGDWRT